MKYNRNYNTFVVRFHDITLFLLLFTLLVNFKVTSGSWIFFIFHNTKTYVENWKKCYVQTSSFLHTCFLGKMNKLSKVLWFFFTFRKKCVKLYIKYIYIYKKLYIYMYIYIFTIVGRGFLTSLFYEDPLYCLLTPHFQILSNPPFFSVTSTPLPLCSFCCLASFDGWVITLHLMHYFT